MFAFLGGFLTIKVLTGELGPHAYGQLALGVSAAGAVHMFIYGPIEQSALRFVSVYKERGQLDVLFAALRTCHGYAAAILGVVIAIVTIVLQFSAGSKWSVLIFLALTLGLLSGVSSTLSSVQSALRKRSAVALFQASDVWLRLLLSVAGIIWFGSTANIALLGFCLATVTTATIQITRTLRSPEIGPHVHFDHASNGMEKRDAISKLTAYGRPYIAFAAFSWFSIYCDRWLVLAYLDERAVGIYAAIFQIASAPIALFFGITNQFLVPMIFDRAGAATSQRQIRSSEGLLNAAVAFCFVGLLGITGIAALFAGSLVTLVTNAEFSTHAEILWILCAGIGLNNLGQMLTVKGLALNQPRKYILPKFIQLCLLIAGIFALAKPLGLLGIALAHCISGAGYLLAVVLTNWRIQHVAN